MRSRWTAFTNTGHRLLLCLPLLLTFVPFVPHAALGKGGTNVHEPLPASRTAVPTYQPTFQAKASRGEDVLQKET